jgi:hypothetical protein
MPNCTSSLMPGHRPNCGSPKLFLIGCYLSLIFESTVLKCSQKFQLLGGTSGSNFTSITFFQNKREGNCALMFSGRSFC